MNKFYFNGRPDGLGNRIEEIIRLELLLKNENLELNYLWNNKFEERSYEILLTSKSINITEKFDDKAILFERVSYSDQYIEQSAVLDIARQIKPTFQVEFENNTKPTGIHIRGTDRIGLDHPHFMKDNNEFYEYLSKTISLINYQNPKSVFICADSDKYRDQFIKYLNKDIMVVEPICDKSVPNEYRDLFALSLCDRIFMCSKFSSFSIIASLIGNIPIVCYNYDKVISNRYKAIFEYELKVKQGNHVDFLKKESTLKLKLVAFLKKGFNIRL
jgi:hypothetical protein